MTDLRRNESRAGSLQAWRHRERPRSPSSFGPLSQRLKASTNPGQEHGAQPLLSKAYSEKGKSTGGRGGQLRQDDSSTASDFRAHSVPAGLRPWKAKRQKDRFFVSVAGRAPP